MSGGLNSGLIFLVNTLFDLYLFVLVLRVILVWSGANYYDPITQFVVKLTGCCVNPLRKIIPNIRGIESASIILILLIEAIKFFIIGSISVGIPSILGVLVLSVGDSLKLVIQSFFYAILLQAIMSWVQPYSPINQLLSRITSPLMRPIQRVIPPIGGMDISPIPAMIGLQLLLIVLVNPIMAAGFGMAFN